jgi:hypothetical protein
MTPASKALVWSCVSLLACFGCSSGGAAPAFPAVAPGRDGLYHVHPGENIQAALESASKDPVHKTIRVHAGVYRPSQSGQALIWLNRRHDGITLEAEGKVILTAANAAIADKSAKGYPAIVNHVLYLGDGVTERTIIRGFTLTGANNFVTTEAGVLPVESDTGLAELQTGLFFYADGGGIKVFGRSYPTILNLTIEDNYTSPCGAGISIEQRGFNEHAVMIRNCIFRNNRCQITGSAIDLLPGSSAVISNCLFVGNVSNTGINYVGGAENPYNAEHGSGALTVLPDSRVQVDRCTFTGNWNGADDKGTGSVYTGSIFWMNTKSGGISPKERYELDILDGKNVSGCFFQGVISDLRNTISVSANTFDAPDPEFDSSYRPRAEVYANAGYRPDIQE